MQIKDIRNGSYTLKGKISFDSNVGKIEMSATDALNIAYTLFDWAGIDYSILDKLSKKVEE